MPGGEIIKLAITKNPFVEELTGAATLIAAAGKDHVASTLLDVPKPAVHVDQVVVFTFSLDGKPV